MNTIENKSYLWRYCVENNFFSEIPTSMIEQVRGLFEKTVKEYENENVELDTSNKLFIKDFRVKIFKLGETIKKEMDFQKTEQEYKSMLITPKPKEIEFSKERDKPIENLEKLIEEKTKERDVDIHKVFTEDHKNKALGLVNQVNLGSVEESNVFKEIQKMYQVQNKILQSIVESQIKIIDLLQKSRINDKK
jgi:hypothetical protein